MSSEGGCKSAHGVKWLSIPNQEASVKEDVAKVVESTLTAPGIPVHGYIYSVETGKINHVVSAVTK